MPPGAVTGLGARKAGLGTGPVLRAEEGFCQRGARLPEVLPASFMSVPDMNVKSFWRDRK